ncbi:hypothetical protein MASR1M60_15780 [Rhodocyclaceae bacterium]
MSELRDAIVDTLHAHLNRVLSVAEVDIPSTTQYQAFRKIALDEFGMQGFLPELDALLKQHGTEWNGQAKTAGKGGPR